MDALDAITHAILRWLPAMADAAVYGALAALAAVVYLVGFLAIVGSFYRWNGAFCVHQLLGVTANAMKAPHPRGAAAAVGARARCCRPPRPWPPPGPCLSPLLLASQAWPTRRSTCSVTRPSHSLQVRSSCVAERAMRTLCLSALHAWRTTLGCQLHCLACPMLCSGHCSRAAGSSAAAVALRGGALREPLVQGQQHGA